MCCISVDVVTVVNFTERATSNFDPFSGASLLIARLALSMILALPPTVTLCDEDIVTAVRRLVAIVLGDLQRVYDGSFMEPGRASAAIPALHNFLSSFTVLIGDNPGLLTDRSLKKLIQSSERLSRAYRVAHDFIRYLDAEGRDTYQYLNLIGALHKGETPPTPFIQPRSPFLRPVRETLHTPELSPEQTTVEGLSLPFKFDSGSREHRGRNRESSTRTWSLYSIIYPFIGRFLLV